jgi:hypothetical protein
MVEIDRNGLLIHLKMTFLDCAGRACTIIPLLRDDPLRFDALVTAAASFAVVRPGLMWINLTA